MSQSCQYCCLTPNKLTTQSDRKHLSWAQYIHNDIKTGTKYNCIRFSVMVSGYTLKMVCIYDSAERLFICCKMSKYFYLCLLNGGINSAEVSFPGYVVYRQDRRDTHYGIGRWVLLYVRDESVSVGKSQLQRPFVSSVWCDLYTDNSKRSSSVIKHWCIFLPVS